MSTEINIEQFSGPLDFLLQLIEKEKLNINEIALSKVTEQFFEYLDKLENDNPEELADFLVVATKLVYIKSCTILPEITSDDEDMNNLAEQLKMYKKYIDASKNIQKIWEKNLLGYGRTEPRIKTDVFVLPQNSNQDNLRESFLKLLKNLKPINPLPKVSINRAVTVKQKLKSIYDLLKSKNKLKFSDLLTDTKNKTDVIISFLAILELVKSGNVNIKQESSFGYLEISKI